jgi:hypothetical protein
MMSWEGLEGRGVPWIPKKRMASSGNPSERFHDHLIRHNLSHLCRRGWDCSKVSNSFIGFWVMTWLDKKLKLSAILLNQKGEMW